MSIYGDKQFRKVYVKTAVMGTASARATPDLLADGEVQAFRADGADEAAAGERFKIFTNIGGVIESSDAIDPANVIVSKLTPYVADQNKVMTITIPTPVVGQSFEVRLLVKDFGMTSAWDYVTIYGQFIAEDTVAANVATGLAAAINASIAKYSNVTIAATTSTADLILTGSNTDYKLFQFDGKPIDFEVSLLQPSEVAAVLTTPIIQGKGEGYDVANLEHFSKMVTGDAYAASEISYSPTLLADAALTYDMLEISYYSERASAPGDKQRKVITIASLASLTAADVNAQLVDPLQLIGLSGLVDLA